MFEYIKFVKIKTREKVGGVFLKYNNTAYSLILTDTASLIQLIYNVVYKLNNENGDVISGTYSRNFFSLSLPRSFITTIRSSF